ncbi:MAG: diguanylate cyclase [Gammaproteobacteria bacterium]
MAEQTRSEDTAIDLPATVVGEGEDAARDPFAARADDATATTLVQTPPPAAADVPGSGLAFDLLVAVVLLQLILLALAAFRIIRLREQLRADRDATISARSEARQVREQMADLRVAATQELHHRTDGLRQQNQLLSKHRDELEQINARLRELVKNDPLTGLVNGARFTEQLEAELRRCLRIGKPLTVIVCDIDDFRGFNAHHGEERGDLLLRNLSGQLESIFRRGGDTIARLDSDRFSVLAPDTDYRAAVAYAERFRKHVEQWPIPVEDGDDIPPVTVSLGITVVEPDSAEETRTVLERAALALSLAKKKGGNRVYGDRLRGKKTRRSPVAVSAAKPKPKRKKGGGKADSGDKPAAGGSSG